MIDISIDHMEVLTNDKKLPCLCLNDFWRNYVDVWLKFYETFWRSLYFYHMYCLLEKTFQTATFLLRYEEQIIRYANVYLSTHRKVKRPHVCIFFVMKNTRKIMVSKWWKWNNFSFPKNIKLFQRTEDELPVYTIINNVKKLAGISLM